MECRISFGMTRVVIILVVVVVLMISPSPSSAQLSSSFYDSTCPNAASTIRSSIEQAVSRETRMAASLIRLHFHDCFVQGCDASILLDDTSDIQSEKSAGPNRNSVRGYEVIDAAKTEVESICPGVVSCADILTLAARDASVAVGGPSWDVKLGRRDSTDASFDQANTDLPGPNSDLQTLIDRFSRKNNLTPRDMVALSGSHTIGQARCVTFRSRIYDNGSDIDADFASSLRSQCPQTNGEGDSNLAPLDVETPNAFDNNYYRNLIQRRGLLQSDQVLFSGQSTDSIVSQYSNNPSTFAADFASAMIKMSEIDPKLGQDGIIRRICSAIN